MARQLLVRNSEIQTYKECRVEWEWNYLLRLQPRNSRAALRFGELGHRSLERYYIPGRERGPHPAGTFTALYHEQIETQPKFGVRNDDGEWEEVAALGHDMLTRYVDEYGGDEHLQIIAPEMIFKVDIEHPKTGRYFFSIVGQLDAVFKDLRTGEFGILDHKFVSSISTEHLTLDEQASTYFFFGPVFLRQQGILGEDEELTKIVFNFLRKAKGDVRPRNAAGQYLNKDKTVSKRQPPAFFHREPVWRDEADREEFVSRLINTVWEKEQVRKGNLPIYKTPGYNMSNCRSCAFRGPCELHESGSDWEEVLNLEYETWDPYAAHELARKG